MLLLHGYAQTCHSWDFVALAMCDRFRVLSLDQRGHGDTDWAPDGDYTPEAYWTDLHAVTEALDLRDFVLMGLSMGGRNAISYAANHPGRVRALVVVDSAPTMQRAGTDRMRRFVQGDDVLDSVDAFVKRVQEYNPLRPAEQIRGSIVHNLKQLPDGRWDLEVRQGAQVAGQEAAGQGLRRPLVGGRSTASTSRPSSCEVERAT